MNELVKKGVRITRSTRQDIFEIIENSFNMFGYANQDFDVFAIKELESGEISIIGENVVVSAEEELPHVRSTDQIIFRKHNLHPLLEF